uniref:hypothetical protein n=1 Tax=Algoriphagus sp. TaxID=1872435 RepID=UPI00258BB151|nr:hypothetical protein [Algoriphagus sp.]
MLKYESQIVTYLAEKISKEISGKCIKDLQESKNTLSGPDTGLINTWDEICAQIQGEYSFHWDTYEDTVELFIQPYLEKLNPYERFAIWLQTDEGMRYDEDEDKEPEIYSFAVLRYVKGHIFQQAGKWSNQRIRKYLERGGELDM